MSNTKLYQRLRDLSFALTQTDDEDTIDTIENEIDEIQNEIDELEKLHFGMDRHEEH